MWEWRIFGQLNEITQELLDSLALTLSALKVSQLLLPERRTDLFIVLPLPNVGIKFRNLATSSPTLEIKVAKEIEGSCGAQKWLKKRVGVPLEMDIMDDHAVRQSIIGSGVEELEQVEIKFPLERLRITKERQQWKLSMATQPVKVEITTVRVAVNDEPEHKKPYFTVCVESKSTDALTECLVKLAIGEMFELHAIQNIYVVEAIHLKPPRTKASPSSPSKSSTDLLTMIPPTSSSSESTPPLSPLKKKVASEGARLRLIEMGYPAFACFIMQEVMSNLGKVML